jgi:glycine betaine/proline transport system permease protein
LALLRTGVILAVVEQARTAGDRTIAAWPQGMSIISRLEAPTGAADNSILSGLFALFVLALLPFDWSWHWPREWIIAPGPPITAGFKWLARDFTIEGVQFSVILRSMAKIVELPMIMAQSLLAKGFGPLGSTFPPMPWFALLGAAMIFAHWAAGWRLFVLILVTGVYLLIFGLWASAMMTLASVLIAVVVGSLTGMILGVIAWRSSTAEAMLEPIYDLLQVLPIFSYLVPILVFFGFGPLAGLVATVVFAMPPMARTTTLALRTLPRSIFELASMVGCSRSQAMLLVLLPASRDTLLVGLNQVVNLSFAVAVFAAIIGAGGLGTDLFSALKSLKLGPATEAGIAITLLAVALDRTFRAIASRRPAHLRTQQGIGFERHLHAIAAAALIAIGLVAAATKSELTVFPKPLTFSTGSFSNEIVASINTAAGQSISRFRDAIVIGLLRPVKDTLLTAPWLLVMGISTLSGILLEGPRLALIIAALLLPVVVTGYWDAAMTSLYLVLLATMIAALIGFPLGMIGALDRRVAAVNDVVVDTIQTLPPFVYLVPVIMVLGIGDVPALAAIALYALAPAIRFTQSGLLQVTRSVLEAATMSGCTRLQTLRLVQLPIAKPYLLLGLNQTVIMAFGMLVITALVGTRGLEANTLKALGKVDTGEGLVAGFCLVAITAVCDRLLKAWTSRSMLRNHAVGANS